MSEQDSSHGKSESVPAYQDGGGDSRQIEFPPTIEANAVSAVLDGEDPTHVMMPASENELKDPQKRIHQPCSRLRSKVPFASSQVNNEWTLPRASAMEQSAAP